MAKVADVLFMGEVLSVSFLIWIDSIRTGAGWLLYCTGQGGVMGNGFVLMLSLVVLTGCTLSSVAPDRPLSQSDIAALVEKQAPAPAGMPYAAINRNQPFFTKEEISYARNHIFERYSRLDHLGRCGTASARIGQEVMPAGRRGAIGMVRPSGWQVARYDHVEGRYLYNRCHLIGYQLAGENANPLNLITCTRYMNTKGMLPFENQVAEYVRKTGNHVLYRVTPVFRESNLVAWGALMEAWSLEDDGKVHFNVFTYNTQPGVAINYTDGSSQLAGETVPDDAVAVRKSIERHRRRAARKRFQDKRMPAD